MFVRTIMVFFFVVSFYSYGAKKECIPLLDKLQNIQSDQRQGQSFKSSVKLREKEDIARQKWWDCENNKTKPQVKKKTVNKTAKKKIKLANNFKPIVKKAPPVFSSNQEIVVKGRFSGDKQLQWLSYYKRPKKCARPKTTQIFAFCMEDKTAQQDKFEAEYENNK